MAKKKSERYRDRDSGSVLQVRDEGRILGNLVVNRRDFTLPFPRPRLFVDNRPVVTDAVSASDHRYRQYSEMQKRERRPRTITKDGEYIRFPDFVIRAEKLLPVVIQVIKGGMWGIEYSNLRRLLGM